MTGLSLPMDKREGNSRVICTRFAFIPQPSTTIKVKTIISNKQVMIMVLEIPTIIDRIGEKNIPAINKK